MMHIEPAAPVPKPGPAPIQGIGMLIGLLFLVLGAGELIPGVTTAAGEGTARELFGVFAVSGTWTLVHLLTGVTAIFCTRSSRLASRFLLVAGIGYVVLGIAGLLPLPDAVGEVLPMNSAGVCLALGFGTAMAVLGAGWLRGVPSR